MKKINNFYITTTLPYVNADPHIGFAAEIVRADAIARYQRSLGKNVFFNTGTDEHGKKIYENAKEKGVDPQVYCNGYAAEFGKLGAALNLSYDNFIRTTDPLHVKAAQEFWRRCDREGYIYKKMYKVKYCVGCELEVSDSELVNGRCQWHPNKDLEVIEEENYFFKFSEFGDKLIKLYENRPDLVVPAHRLNEVKRFIESGLKDFSISRLKEKMPWGVAVPGDEKHVIYVWFDALVNYIAAIGWPDDMDKFESWWPVVQVAGKDNLRQQSAMWQAMLMSVGLPPSETILIFGFIGADGKKMSKSLGNVINPFDLVAKYGCDATRYYLLSELQAYEDSDFSYDKFETRYNADLANGFGNLVARVSNLLEKNEIEIPMLTREDYLSRKADYADYHKEMQGYQFNNAIKVVLDKLKKADEILSDKKPWKMIDKAEIKKVLEPIAVDIYCVAEALAPFIPQTAQIVTRQFSQGRIKKGDSLFPRIN